MLEDCIIQFSFNTKNSECSLYNRFDNAGYSIAQTKEVLSSIASDCLIDDGYCVNAFESLWTPSDPNEVLAKSDVTLDFPELIDL